MLDTWRIGESKRISQIVSADATFVIASATISIYNSAGTAVISAASCSLGAINDQFEIEVYYIWTPADAGDYTYLIKYVVGTQTLGVRGTAYVLPVTSKYDRWVYAAVRKTQEATVGEDQQSLTYRDYMEAVDAARRRYQRDWPRRRLNHADGVVMTANDWEYALPADWADGFSQILQFEYPVDATIQTRAYLEPGQFAVDPLRSVWTFTGINPSTGYYARFAYTAEHTLSHTEDTLPSHHFDAIATWAAGEALEYLANEATRTDARTVAADAVNYRTKQQERRSQAAALKSQAVAMWQPAAWSF